ncbi:MAG: DUF4105 domain-containing protein, partial [Dysgonamonadaceae bacterium]|nr:DUF4105 domain-containing protein [Dysgonamonadaceae bacterium]
MKRYFLWFISILLSIPAHAYQTDSLQVSLLTIEPRTNQVYTIYGHTALRLCDPSQQMDIVFNWGTFDFSAPHFLYRFIRGETDYFLSYANYEQFLYAYTRENAAVIEQILDLPPEGKNLLLQKLSINLQPENLIYRYNFLFDNCTTRVRDLIEQSRPGLIYPDQTDKTTFRTLIHSCTEPYPWMTFGIDLLIGSGADSLISVRQELFLPVKLSEALDKSVFLPTAHPDVAPVVLSSQPVLTAVSQPEVRRSFWESPVRVGYFILLIYSIIIIVGRIKHRPLKGWFVPLFFIAGASGCLLAFMAVFSYHPCVSPNWNLLWLHPFHLIAFAGYLNNWRSHSVWTKVLFWYHAGNFVLLCGLLLGGHWMPQTFHPADIPFILCLAL